MTDTQRAAMQQALDALEYAHATNQYESARQDRAIVALREALAEPVVEPAFWLNELGQMCATRGFAERSWPGQKLTPLYASPPANVPMLTDENILWLWNEAYKDTTDKMPFQVFTRAIEQRVRQKAGIK